MEAQRKKSGTEQEKYRSLIQKAQENIKSFSKESKEIKTKLSQVMFEFLFLIYREREN